MQTETARQAWDERYSAREYVWTVEVNQFVEAHLADLEPGTAIDLAAGEGRNSVWLAMRGWEVTAVDFSSVGLAKANRLAEDNKVSIKTVEADATTYQHEGLVDLVVVSYLQLEPEGRQAALEHAKTWLRPGATLFLIAHDRSNIDNGWGGPSAPQVCYTPEEATAALDGLEIKRAEVAERPVSTDDGEQIALDTLVIATRP
ncbi:MAG: class I SAM-dependent methyltransferase [Actinomycetia bacterium]|nr:class I SAM-dependent methyltransferase [Actinomycetes bacterium]MCP4223343.1 class I SAM-dependent methyltransferase [Actinomycetes bacterium]MCP5034961.1 class I SAM-dependent methyltransferase [Actinomycetes bacterium]